MKALIVYGGWDGHQPKEVSELLQDALTKAGFDVRREDKLDSLADEAGLKKLDVVVPIWTMGQISKEQWAGLNAAVRSGVGIGGVHGGMGDAFRGNLEYQWMVGGQFVGHPHVGEYTVRLTDLRSPITDGMKPIFDYRSEQYYMIVDPSITVLADTLYNHQDLRAVMPVVWTKTWGNGRVFYSALGHVAQEFIDYPEVLAMTVRGITWAARGKKL